MADNSLAGAELFAHHDEDPLEQAALSTDPYLTASQEQERDYFDDEPEPPARRRRRWAGWSVLLVFLASVGVSYGVYAFAFPPPVPEIGQCMAGQPDGADATGLRSVPCGRDAEWRVIGRNEGVTQEQATPESCARWKDADLVYFSSARLARTGTSLCLTKA
ncbi:hypothetical protein D5S17_19090 [Pseudonocardiaceae bacterium YIM PH 21723]|nr:hypothetical protein D5S17_19090 [Pseudonocardiaceae bacterium YIM PH 21723]